MKSKYYDNLNWEEKRVFEAGRMHGIYTSVFYGIIIFVVLYLLVWIPSDLLTSKKQKAMEAEYKEENQQAYENGYIKGFWDCYDQVYDIAEEQGFYIEYDDLEKEYCE